MQEIKNIKIYKEKIIKKRSLCLILVFVMISNIMTITYANSTNREENRFLNENSYKSNEMYYTLVDIGFSDEEIVELYQKEADKVGINFKLPEVLEEKTNIHKVITTNKNPQALMLRTNNGDKRYRSISINFNEVARYCNWPGTGSAVGYIIGNVTKSQFIKAVVSCTGLQWAVAITSVAGVVFASLSYWHKGIDLYITEVYWYDEYERMGKWNLVDADYKFW